MRVPGIGCRSAKLLVSRGSGEQWEYLVEYFPLQGRLVSLDGHQEIPSGLAADVFRGFPLGVRGVERDQD